MTIAMTILEQLGGRRFQVMTGASGFLDHGSALSFRLPGKSGFVRQGINYVKVELTPADLYRVEFGRVRTKRGRVTPDYRVMAEYDDIFTDYLQDLFRDVTGLETHL